MAPRAKASASQLDAVKILDASQTSTASHKSLSKQLQSLCKQIGTEQFTERILRLLQPLMLISKKHSGAERVIRFLRTFCLEHQDDELTISLINACLKFCRARDRTVRYRSCEIVGQLMDTLTAEDDNEEEDPARSALYSRLVATMKLCLMDSHPKVRTMAVNALYRLHNAEDEDDDVLQVLLLAMSEDSCHDVRRLVLKKVLVTPVTLLHILRMTRDVCTENRKLAYTIIRDDINFTKITITQRVLLLRDGFSDREPSVRKAAQDMLLNGWLKSVDNDPIKMLSSLDVETYIVHLRDVINCLIDHQRSRLKLAPVKVESTAEEGQEPKSVPKGNRLFTFDMQNIDSESVIFWHHLCIRLKAEGREEELEEQLPTLTEFCDLIITLFFQQAGSREGHIKVAEEADNTFVLTQLITMCTLFDLGDEAGRRKLLHVLLRLLQVFDAEQPGQYIKPLMAALRHLFQDSRADYLQTVEVAIAKLRGADEPKVTDVTEVEVCIEEQNRNRAQKQQQRDTLVKQCEKLKHKLAEDPREEELRSTLEKLEAELLELETQLYHDEIVWMRCLHILIDFLEHTSRSQKRGIPDFISRTILAATQQQSTGAVYELALWALGLWCHLDLAVVPTHLPIFITAVNHSEPFVREKALHCLVDIIMVWGVPAIQEQIRKLACISNNNEADSCSQNLFDQSQATNASAGTQEPVPLVQSSAASADAIGDCTTEMLDVIIQLLVSGRVHTTAQIPKQEHSETEQLIAERCLQSIACEGMAKLLASNRWPHHPETPLAQLLLNFYNPALISKLEGVTGHTDNTDSDSDSEDTEETESASQFQITVEKASSSMRQCLTVFFLAYAFASPQRQLATLQAVIVALRHLLSGSYRIMPPISPDDNHLETIRRPNFQMTSRPPQISQFIKHALHLTDCQNLTHAGKVVNPSDDADEAVSSSVPSSKAQLLQKCSIHEDLLTAFLAEVIADPSILKRSGQLFRTVLCGARLYAKADSPKVQYLAFLVRKISDMSSGGLLTLDTLTSSALDKLQTRLKKGPCVGSEEVAAEFEAKLQATIEQREQYMAAHQLQTNPACTPKNERKGRRAGNGKRERASRSSKVGRPLRDVSPDIASDDGERQWGIRSSPKREGDEEMYESLADEERRRQASQLAAHASESSQMEPSPISAVKQPIISEFGVKKRSSTFTGPPPFATSKRSTADVHRMENDAGPHPKKARKRS